MIQRTLETGGELFPFKRVLGRPLTARDELAVGRHVRVERDLIRTMAPAPEPVAVARLVDGDAVNPGAQARLTTKTVDGTENTQEDLLREVEGFVAVAQEVRGKLHY